jgi:hypothetical protein
MKIFSKVSLASAVSLAALLSACNAQSQLRPATASEASSQRYGFEAGKGSIRPPNDPYYLYVSDKTNNVVDVFAYPSGTPVGGLTGFNSPQGLCANSSGDVFVTNTGTSQIYVFPPGSGTQLATVNDYGELPMGCAVAPNGELAVTNLSPVGGGSGSVSLYNGSLQGPTIITSSAFESMYFDGFDNQNNLFIDGTNSSGGFQLGKLPAGSGTIQPITVTGATIGSPGGVQYTLSKVNVGDQTGHVVYRMSEAGVVSGSTQLTGAVNCVQGTILKVAYICPDSGTTDTEFFKYPAGGSATKTLTGFSDPIGTVIVRKPGQRPNHPPEILNFFEPYPCGGSSSPPCPTDFEVGLAGNVTGLIPSNEPLFGPYNPFCPPSHGQNNPCPPTVTFNATLNQTIVEFSGATVYHNTVDGYNEVHFGLLASQNQNQGLWGLQQSAYWTYGPLPRQNARRETSPPPQPVPIISVASNQPNTSTNWKYAIVFVGASAKPRGGATYGSWWAIGYVPHGSAQPLILFRNYGKQVLYVTSSGILLNQPVPTDLACLSNPACSEDMTILSTENTVGLPPPGAKGSPFTKLTHPPPSVLKPFH